MMFWIWFPPFAFAVACGMTWLYLKHCADWSLRQWFVDLAEATQHSILRPLVRASSNFWKNHSPKFACSIEIFVLSGVRRIRTYARRGDESAVWPYL